MDDRTFLIFIVGCIVFTVTLAAGFFALIASDHPNEPRE